MLAALLLAASLSSAPAYPQCIVRDHRGRIARSATARQQFRHTNPCPAPGANGRTCPGYVIDHIVPLKRCGTDTPANMQWQTTRDARAKDRWE